MKSNVKGFSIITDFGCRSNCSYCIWKNHHSFYGKDFNEENYLQAVENFISEIVTADKFSISGGGDPLHNFGGNDFITDFWKIIFNSDKKVDIHTSYTTWYNLSYAKNHINKMVFHTNCFRIVKDWPTILNCKKKFSNVRINFVVTNDIDISTLKWVENTCRENRIQLSYRECVGLVDIDTKILEFCKNIADRYKLGRYVNQADYNIYLFPDGKIYDKFLF